MDDWIFRPGETWFSEVVGKEVHQSAPARVSRGLPLPTVLCEGDLPFVTCARFPNGAVSVCTSGRVHVSKGWLESKADVSLDVGDATGPFGVFGVYRSLTLKMSAPIGKSRIYAQELAGTKAIDITKQIEIGPNWIKISGDLLAKIGKQNSTPGDLSDPGLVVAVVNSP